MQQYTVYLYLQTALHVTGGISTHHQELISLYLQYLALMRLLLLPVVNVSHPVTFTTGSSNGLINARYCRCSVMSSWWWVEMSSETCWELTDINKLYTVASCWIIIDTDFMNLRFSWQIKYLLSEKSNRFKSNDIADSAVGPPLYVQYLSLKTF